MFLSVTHANVSLNYRSRSESPMLMLLSITHAKVFPSHPRSCFSVSIAQDWYLFMEPALAVGPEVRTQLAEGVAGSVPYPWMLRQRKWFRRNIPHTLCSYQCSFFSLAYMPALLFSFFSCIFPGVGDDCFSMVLFSAFKQIHCAFVSS